MSKTDKNSERGAVIIIEAIGQGIYEEMTADKTVSAIVITLSILITNAKMNG